METQGVTVAIPNWNHELLLARSISSALAAVRIFRNQGIPAETLVIDDCSRDGSLTFLRQLEALHYRDGLRVLARSSNGGLAAARNLALEQARHRYIVFMDADNELLPETMPLFRRALVETGVAVAYGNLIVSQVTAGNACGILNNESFQQRMFQGNYIDAFAMVDRMQLLDAQKYSALLPGIEDYEMWLHLACNGRRLIFVPLVFGYYYLMPNSMITQHDCSTSQPRVKRVFDQAGARAYLSLPTLHLRYHPAIGYV
ncbi:MAG: glycosyltransferase family 2 protein [Gemmataceae bacterium]